ncbi:MAG: hypothetical protein KVP17_003138 [Porospora cf. gigantea B]|uniref:uncharacterized protein n=1 Tax=Porospora cf. gigantea B TaxID=2853592 RepID=UPI003571D380|nr:MAG: hypothetical protein KVP17_003138 [Porospora cf. gigantea B]
MDTVIGIQGKDFVLLATDTYAAYSIIRMKQDENKMFEIDDNKVIATAGPQADRNSFGDYIRANVHLHRLRNDRALSTHALANFSRSELARALRSNPYQVNCMVAGSDEGIPKLYWMDFMASMVPVTRGAHGYGSNFLLGLLDKLWHPDITREEALRAVEQCRDELSTRFLLSQSRFAVKIVDTAGTISTLKVEA